jgi:hypothetical protein
MKILIISITLLALFTSCDVQSEMTKKSVEKYLPTPTPSISPTPVPEPIDAADVVTVETSAERGNDISVYKSGEKRTASCTKYNDVMVNGSDTVITLKGACRRIEVNGNGNKITSEAVSEIIINGLDNNVTYSRFVNGKRPIIKDNRSTSIVEKIAAPAAK